MFLEAVWEEISWGRLGEGYWETIDGSKAAPENLNLKLKQNLMMALLITFIRF